MRIRDILYNGASFTAGYAVGRLTASPIEIAEPLQEEKERGKEFWEGQTNEYDFHIGGAERYLEDADDLMEWAEEQERPFVRDDLSMIETRLLHALGDIEDKDSSGEVRIKMSDRELFHYWLAHMSRSPMHHSVTEKD